MASSYALPSLALPHAHQQHIHAQSHSQSPLNAWRASMSRDSLSAQSEDESRERLQSHSRHHSHSRMGPQALNSNTSLTREKPPPAALDTHQGWTRELTAGGKFVVTPSPGTFTMPYLPPSQHSYGHDTGHDDDDQGHDGNDGLGLCHSHKEHDHAFDRNARAKVTAATSDVIKSNRSFLTRVLLSYTPRFPILHAIMIERDSRRIFYFMMLNFCFMTVQAFYGYLTDSLGLMSDSIHMFFDCVALFVGLLAAVMSKWPPSQKFPYGFGKIEALSGFANGILLMLLSVEIASEAFERLWEGARTKRLGELFVVSSLGLAVNLVGMMAFGHHHHHGGHSHCHHSHDHDDNTHPHADGPGSHSHSHSHSHGHQHDNDNMHGIYLHILADTLGSVSVIVSTILTSMWGWAGWDPLASCLIAILIFLSSKPLVFSSARRLLLSVPEDIEYSLRSTLGGILQQRGVVKYTAPKLWLDDRTGSQAGGKLVGVVHISVAQGASMNDTRDRVREHLLREGIDVVVQAERDGDMGCWCARTWTPTTPFAPKPF